jgi:predicted phage baseplate assembly protein
MSLPTPNLDDLRFQHDLVDEARRRIIRYCPEWTDYNLSDPGITLIELFAWMAEKLAYRLNRVPDKNYIKFMELLGIQLQPANSARVELTFRLSTSFPITPEDDTAAIVPQGIEVATRVTPEAPEVTFTTDERLVIYPPKLEHLRREQDFVKNYLPRMGVELFYAFSHPRPQPGDMFYIGFDETKDLSGHILKLDFTCEETQATGVRRNDPPWVWECSIGNGQWQEIVPSTAPGERDTTGGLNNPRGQIVFSLPLTMQADQAHGRNAYWLRCRLEQRRPEQGMYTQSPRVVNITAYSLGATARATHAVVVREERLGQSSGEPGQVMRLQHTPVLALRPDETVEVEELRDGVTVFVPWTRVDDLAHSDRFDRHFVLESSTGEVSFGPCIRQADGAMFQYGRVPEAGRAIRFNQYRYGGGIAGNVPAGRIEVLKSTVPYIDRVTNLTRADGGRDPETLEEAQMRARREIRAQQRAVTSEDYEGLAKSASRSVARVKCRPPSQEATLPPGTLELLIVPAAFDALRAGDRTKLYLDPELIKVIEKHLDQYRLLTTSLRIREPCYVGVKVKAEIVVSEYSRPEIVSGRVKDGLRALISPLALSANGETLSDMMGPDWEGWPFGRSLFVSEIYALIQKIPGVKHVLDVKLSRRTVVPAREQTPRELQESDESAGAESSASPPSGEEALTPVTQKKLDVPADTLLCSLDHEIEIVEL